MTTYAAADLRHILDLHRKWLYGQEGGARAVLTGAVLRGAVLRGAVLTDADLTDADLTDADLTDADLTGAVLRGAVLRGAVLSDGVTWGEYLSDVVPALCTAGGKALAEVATPEVWSCHRWGSDHEPLGCPMATAFGVHQLRDIPALHRWQASRFIQLYDSNLIKLEDVLRASA